MMSYTNNKNMKPEFDQFLVKVNEFIKTEAAKKDEERSYVRLFRPYNTNKINVMGSFIKAIGEENYSDDNANFTVSSKRSFGMIAVEQFSNYCFLHSKNRFVFYNYETFTSYINRFFRNFVIDDSEIDTVITKIAEMNDDQAETCGLYKIYHAVNEDKKAFMEILQKALYARCLLTSYYSCSLTVYGEEKRIEALKEELSKTDNWLLLSIEPVNDQRLWKKKDDYKLIIKGVPSDRTFTRVNGLTEPVYRVREHNQRLYLTNDQNDKPLSYYFNNEIEFVFEKEKNERFVNILKNDSQIIVKENGNSVVVKYIPSENTLSIADKNDIDGFNLRFIPDKGKRKIIVKNAKDLKPDDKAESLKAIYCDVCERLKYYKSNAGALYSGVVPRLTEVIHREPSMDNATVEGLFLVLGRTSYFTMASMGHTVSKSHPFMSSDFDFGGYKASIKTVSDAVDAYEVFAQDKYYNDMKLVDEKYTDLMQRGINDYQKKIEDDIQVLNDYLKCSFAQHNINISGNLITEDGICLYTLRGGNIEDSGDYYPSVNGASEIYDTDVDFYRNSVEEDIPSIRYSKENVYFGQELTRESIAELGLIDDSHVWNFYGLTCMGQKQAMKGHRMSFHFNVIGERRCMDEFEHIVEQKRSSTENFESKELFGYRLKIHKNIYAKTGAFFIDSMLPEIIENKDTIVWLIVFVLSLFKYNNNPGEGIEEMLTLLFVIASVIMMAYKLYAHLVLRKHEKMVNIIINDSNVLDVQAICNAFCNKLNIKNQIHMDNILRLLTLMRLTDYFKKNDESNQSF